MPYKKILPAILLLILFLPAIPASGYTYEKILDEPWDQPQITVFIDEKNLPPHYSPTYRTQVEKALEYWEGGGNGNLAYTPVFEIVDSEKADIRIRWVENLENVEDAPPGVAGYARPHIENGRFVRVDIVLETGNFQGRAWRQYGDATVLAIAKHEIGHALGLGHSDNPRDIMYPEYEMRDNINPLLLSKYAPVLRIGALAAFIALLFLGISWRSSRKKRKRLEEKYLK